MSPRQICHQLPTDGGEFAIYTYDTKHKAIRYESMGERVYVDFDSGALRMSVQLSPEQARHLALYLASVADACEANRARHSAARASQSTTEITP